MTRIWRAFRRGFWTAWLAVPPKDMRSAGEVMVTLTCDDSQFQSSIDGAIASLVQLQYEAARTPGFEQRGES